MGFLEKDKAMVWHPYTAVTDSESPLLIEKANGVFLFDSSGRAILDAVGSWWVNLHGHSHPYIAQKIFEQAQKLEHVMFAGFTHQPAIQLAERLLGLFRGHFSKIFYSDNGSTAIEVALKMSFQYWYNLGKVKKKVLALEGSYHGDTFGAMSVGERSIFTQAFQPFLFEVEYLPIHESSIQKAQALFAGGEYSCFIFEPLIQGASGMKMHSATWLDSILEVAQKNEVICIADEVFTGFGRTGSNFAIDYLKNQPEIICLSKGLTGGALPLGVTLCIERIHQAFKEEKNLSKDLEGLNIRTFFHGHSFTANPLACVSALASLDLFQEDSCQAAIQMIEESHLNFQNNTPLSDYPSIQNIRTKGVVLAIDYLAHGEPGYLSELRNELYNYFLEKSILMRPLGNTVYVVPPYCITQDQLQLIYRAILDFKPKIVG